MPQFLTHPAFLVAAIAVALFLGAELYLRIRYRNLLWVNIYPQVYEPDEDLGYRYRPNAAGEIRIPGIHRRFRINNQGFHGRDFALAKPPGTFRIALIGTSNTTGIWCHGEGRNFGELLEVRLRNAGHEVEILNFGIDGRFRALHEMKIVETDVARFEPDLVLIDIDLPFVYGIFQRALYKGYVMIYNPEEELSRKWCEALIDHVVAYRYLPYCYYASYIVRAAVRYYMNHYNTARSAHLRIFVENRIQAPDIVVLPCSIKRSIEALQKARETIAQHGGELVVFQYSPSPYHRAATGKYGLPYLELNVPPTPEFVHDRDGHYRQAGHAAVADQLFEQLTTSGLLRHQDEVPRASAAN